MIELLDPRKITPVHSDLWQKAGWSYRLDYSWIITHAKTINGLILDVGCGVKPCSPLGKRLGELLKAEVIGIDRKHGKEFADYVPPKAPGLIVWASSLEHNKPADMRALYLRSMDMLAPGGMFLATITISPNTHWCAASENLCLSPDEAVTMFDEDGMSGSLADTWMAYRQDVEIVKRYRKRYGRFEGYDPEFVIAGVRKVK